MSITRLKPIQKNIMVDMNTSPENVTSMIRCRYCKRIETNQSNLMVPCDCYGENKYTHETCLEAAYRGHIDCWSCRSSVDKWREIADRQCWYDVLVLLFIEFLFVMGNEYVRHWMTFK